MVSGEWKLEEAAAEDVEDAEAALEDCLEVCDDRDQSRHPELESWGTLSLDLEEKISFMSTNQRRVFTWVGHPDHRGESLLLESIFRF